VRTYGYFEGAAVGTLPCRIDQLLVGQVQVSIRHPGYETVEHLVELPTVRPLTVQLHRTPAGPPGRERSSTGLGGWPILAAVLQSAPDRTTAATFITMAGWPAGATMNGDRPARPAKDSGWLV
jgi:hypothetical protein